MTLASDTAPLRRVLMKHARDAFGSPSAVDAEWRGLNYLGPPDFDAACRESDALAALLERLGVEVVWAGGSHRGLDAIYVRDASVLLADGALLCRMGKEARRAEPGALAGVYTATGIDVLGEVAAPGTLEGGDVAWVDERTLAVGRGYRTNAAGIGRLRDAAGPGVEVVEVGLPHWRGPADVFHLMSIYSPLAPDLALVYSPLMPVPFRELLLERGIALVEVPSEELDSMGCNVLAVAPRVAVAIEGNPETRRRMEAAGVEVHGYVGGEISTKGCGGPTCLTRPLERG